MDVVDALSCLKAIRKQRREPDRKFKYFERTEAQSTKPIPHYDKESGKIFFCGKDVTPVPLYDPQFLTYSDGKRASLKKMDVKKEPPAPEIIPMEEILASKDYVQYYPEEVIIPIEGTAVYTFLQNNQKKGQEEERQQLRIDTSLDELTKDEEDQVQKYYEKKQEFQLTKIDDSALCYLHEYEFVPENKVLIVLKETQTMFLLEIMSVLPNMTANLKILKENYKVEQCSPAEQFAESDKESMLATSNEKGTQTILPCKTDVETVTMKKATKEIGVNPTNATIYDDIKQYEDREAKNLLAEIEKQKKILYDLLMDPNGQFKMELHHIQGFLTYSYWLINNLNPKFQLDEILKFIKEFEENHGKKENDLSDKLEDFIELSSNKNDQSILEEVVPEEEVETIKELKELERISLEKPLEINPDEEYEKISQSENFISALRVVENILIYQDQIPDINKYFDQEDETDRAGQRELNIAYNLELLWEFSTEVSKGHAINCIAWSEGCSGLFAAGYGKWEYINNLSYSGPGFILLWSVALPRKRPIWKLSLVSSVVSICFHPDTMYRLAIGLSSGDVIIADVNEQMTGVSSIVKLRLDNSYGPAHALSWFRGVGDEDKEKDVFLISGGRKGALFQWNSSKGFLISEKILSLPPVYGKIKGIRIIEPELELPWQFINNPSAKCIAKCLKCNEEEREVNEDPPLLYLVATDDGCIHQCSLDYYHHHVDYFRAHDGPINSLSFNYFSDCIFLTCGADGSVRIWALDVQSPLITLPHGLEYVECAVWSRSHPTIIASISGKILNIWDLQRRTSEPVSKLQNPKNHKLTSVSFSLEGQNVLIGDMDGNLFVYHLEELPIAPYFPEKTLVHAIKHALVNNKSLLKELESKGSPFKGKEKTTDEVTTFI